MKALHFGSCRLLVVVAAALAIAGCGGSQASTSSPSTLGAIPNHARPATATVQVDIRNDWTASIAGNTTASSCWTISSLPVVGAGSVAGPVDITYNASTTCPIPASTGISYGPAVVSGHRCTFNVLYDVNYSYSVTQGTGTACSIEYPPSISGLFVYNQITPSRVRSAQTIRT
jgi:hypothetical protein